MRKICLTVVGMYFMLLHAFSQVTGDSTDFKPRKLKLDEVNLVSSYYTQNGDHSSIRGGIGSEKVTDLANGLELKWVGWDVHQRRSGHRLSYRCIPGLDIKNRRLPANRWTSYIPLPGLDP